MQVTINRSDVIFSPDPKRIIARFFYLTDERSMDVILRVMTMSENEIDIFVNQVLRDFSKRHRNISQVFEKHYEKVRHLFDKLKLIEKWFIAEKLGQDFWKIPSEEYYKQNQAKYYETINLGVNFYELDYNECFGFLEMLPNCLK